MKDCAPDEELVYVADYNDLPTRAAIEDTLIPRMQEKISALSRCRENCSRNPLHERFWRDAGMVEKEQLILAAIKHAQQKLRQ